MKGMFNPICKVTAWALSVILILAMAPASVLAQTGRTLAPAAMTRHADI